MQNELHHAPASAGDIFDRAMAFATGTNMFARVQVERVQQRLCALWEELPMV